MVENTAAEVTVDDRQLEGLDRLQTSTDATATSVAQNVRSSVLKALAPVAALAALVLVWQGYIWLAKPRPDVIPPPASVLETAVKLWGQATLPEAVITSLSRGAIGFVVSAIIGTALGLLLVQVRPLRVAFRPLISGLQVLPSVAWVPAAIIWFGLSDATVYFVLLMGAVPSIINGLISGVEQVPPQFRGMSEVLGANRWQEATRIVLPAAFPGYLGGLKQGWAFSWRSLMAAEIIAVGGSLGFGLGSLLQRGRDLSDMALVLVAIIAILFIGILVELLIFAPLERKVLRSRGLLLG